MPNLTQILQDEAMRSYRAAERLVRMVNDDTLGWKPATGSNWMTVAQLLRHIGDACGSGVKGFVTGDWGLPAGVKMEDMAPEEMLPPAEKLPAVASVAEALELLARDEKIAKQYIAVAGQKNLLDTRTAAPWGGPSMTLGEQLWTMIGHLNQHKSQLFYYLKLMGRPVNTGDLWNM